MTVLPHIYYNEILLILNQLTTENSDIITLIKNMLCLFPSTSILKRFHYIRTLVVDIRACEVVGTKSLVPCIVLGIYLFFQYIFRMNLFCASYCPINCRFSNK